MSRGANYLCHSVELLGRCLRLESERQEISPHWMHAGKVHWQSSHHRDRARKEQDTRLLPLLQKAKQQLLLLGAMNSHDLLSKARPPPRKAKNEERKRQPREKTSPCSVLSKQDMKR